MGKRLARLVRRQVSPVFRHDSESCVFLGRLDGQDLYFYPPAGTLLGRFGNEPHEHRILGESSPEGSPYSLARELMRRKVYGNEYRSMPLLELHEDEDLFHLQEG